MDESLTGFTLDEEILVNLSQVINSKLNKVYRFNLSLEFHWAVVIQLRQFTSQPATQILQNGLEAICDALQEGLEPANELLVQVSVSKMVANESEQVNSQAF